ncbi:MAG: hypothetical protein V4773_04865 [Verrucomicrobiota bacterium]
MKNFFPLLSLANEAPVAAADELRPGVIALANEARFTSANYSQPLTEYIAGWRDTENLLATLDYIAPRVPVSRRFEWKKAENAEAFLSELDDERAIGAGFKRVEYKGTTQLGKTKNRGLTYRIDRDEAGLAGNEERIVALLTQRIRRNQLRRAVTVLLALANNTNKTWSSGTPNPDEEMRTAVAAAQLAGGVFPNRGIIGLAAWNLRAGIYSASDKAGAFAGLAKTPTEVGGMIGLDDLRVDRSLYQSSGTAKTRIMTSAAVFFHAQDLVGVDDPTHVKRFVTPAGDGDLRVYRHEVGAKFIDLTVEHYDEIVGTSTIGAEKLTIS